MTKKKLICGEIKIRPPLSSLVLKYIAVIVLCLSQLATCLKMSLYEIDLFAFENSVIRWILSACSEIGKIGLPLMLVWMVSFILSNKDKLLRLVLFYFALAAGFYIAEMLIINFYIIPKFNEVIKAIAGDQEGLDVLYNNLIPVLVKTVGSYFSNMNVFIDLFLCSSMYYFSTARPKWANTDGNLFVFRSLILFPIAYIITSFVLAGTMYNVNTDISLSIYVSSLLTRNGIVNFVIFGLLMTFCVFREKIYIRLFTSNEAEKNRLKKYGYFTNPFIDPYSTYEKSNRFTINYNLIASLIFIIVPAIDTLLGYIDALIIYKIGGSLSMMLAIPFILAHDYTKKTANKFAPAMIGLIYGVSYFIIFVIYLSYASKIIEPLLGLFDQS